MLMIQISYSNGDMYIRITINNSSKHNRIRHMYPRVTPHSTGKSHDFASAFLIVI